MKASTANVKRSLGLISERERVRYDPEAERPQTAREAGLTIQSDRDRPWEVGVSLRHGIMGCRTDEERSERAESFAAWAARLREAGWIVRPAGWLMIVTAPSD